MRIKVWIVFSFFVLFFCCGQAVQQSARANQTPDGAARHSGETQRQPSVFVPAALYEFEPVPDGEKIVHVFAVQNRGTAPLEIKKVSPG